jgi:hypothetical protein
MFMQDISVFVLRILLHLYLPEDDDLNAETCGRVQTYVKGKVIPLQARCGP